MSSNYWREFVLRSMRRFRLLAVAFVSLVVTASTWAVEDGDAEFSAQCSAYFFIAAKAKPMGEFNSYYGAGEYAYNLAVRAQGEENALALFNQASTGINELIDRNWQKIAMADDRYGVACADLYRAANAPDL